MLSIALLLGFASLTLQAALQDRAQAATCSGQQYNDIPGFPAYNSGCYPTNYYRTSDLGNTSPDDAQSRCQQQCTADSQCQTVVAQVNKAADSNLYSGTCFFFAKGQTVAPRRCANTAYLLEGYVKDNTDACFSASSVSATQYCRSYLNMPVSTLIITSTVALTTTTSTSTVTVVPTVIVTSTPTPIVTVFVITSASTVSKTSFTTTTPTTVLTSTTTMQVSVITSTTTSTTTQISTTISTSTSMVVTTSTVQVTVTPTTSTTLLKKRAPTTVRIPACVESIPPATRLSEACRCLNVKTSTTTSTTTLTQAQITSTTTKTTTIPTTMTTTLAPVTVTSPTTTIFLTTVTRTDTITAPTSTLTSFIGITVFQTSTTILTSTVTSVSTSVTVTSPVSTTTTTVTSTATAIVTGVSCGPLCATTRFDTSGGTFSYQYSTCHQYNVNYNNDAGTFYQTSYDGNTAECDAISQCANDGVAEARAQSGGVSIAVSFRIYKQDRVGVVRWYCDAGYGSYIKGEFDDDEADDITIGNQYLFSQQ